MTLRALVASPTPPAQIAEQELRDRYDWVPLDEADGWEEGREPPETYPSAL